MTRRPETTRFAPSPTGHLHLGHAYAALFAADAAGPGGRFQVRIEDIDQGRARPVFEAAIFEDLAWLGLTWEIPVRRQSDHFDDYAAALTRLETRGLIYPCFCTRRDIAAAIDAPHGPGGQVYPGTCRDLSAEARQQRREAGDPFALRLDSARALAEAGSLSFRELGPKGAASSGQISVDATTFAQAHGDIVVARKDMPTSYHLAVVVDDALQEISLVTRGEDLFEATMIHRLLQALLDLPVPAYHHHRLIVDADGRRFAKRDRAMTLASLRADGITPGEIRGRLGFSRA